MQSLIEVLNHRSAWRLLIGFIEANIRDGRRDRRITAAKQEPHFAKPIEQQMGSRRRFQAAKRDGAFATFHGKTAAMRA